ncbi:MAG: DUF3576 domain-containing protein [Pseudomonadota bacterium]
MRTRATAHFLILSLGLGLAGCVGNSEQSQVLDRREKEIAATGSLFGNEGLTLFGGSRERELGGPAGVAVNVFLWRAALDTISFMPLTQVDPFGGVILTDWHANADDSNTRYKLNIFIIGRFLRADALRVSIFKQNRADANADWLAVTADDVTARKLEDAILTRARQLRLAEKESPQ